MHGVYVCRCISAELMPYNNVTNRWIDRTLVGRRRALGRRALREAVLVSAVVIDHVAGLRPAELLLRGAVELLRHPRAVGPRARGGVGRGAAGGGRSEERRVGKEC